MKKGFLIVAHGSRKDGANQQVKNLVNELNNYFQSVMFEPAFMELASPTIEDGIKALAKKNMDQLIAYPYFLFKGMHFTKDIPNLIQNIINKLEKKVDFKMLDPIGQHPKITDLVQEELYDEVIDQLKLNKVAPSKIEDKSMELIEKNLNGHEIPPEQKPIIKRVIHTTGDFDFLTSIIFHDKAVSAGLKAVEEKKIIFTDVTMVQAGINKKLGHDVRCVLNDPEVMELASHEGITKASAGMKSLSHKLDGNIIAIGNAPTALIELVNMIKNNELKPALIVGIPVGFVNAKESKSYLTTIKDVPYITNRGQKGGSTVAVAIINALIKMAFN
ncbi:MAG TPA: precorrin-8X methylmutase [Nitrospinota bacterium]|jgi:precorrin-8X/cobalt-precorrin-8 methylmutase|nr:precorrin-8X methylmutase [Nitrospinota bacterium]HJN02654.1 precorrin-8X methylmutase [Nitrospinota bacterium]|tara:strand:+ start:1231 stop:2223 length:993 start_codon:yes stop_codon:yes gene_type:complete